MSQHQIPDQMTAIVLDSYSGVEALRVEQRSVPKPGRNEVLVKAAASPINPADLAFIEGLSGFHKPTPVVPGFEGSGTVVEAGSGMMGRYLTGKRVACLGLDKGDVVWAEYIVTSTNYALPLDKSVSLEQGAMSVINPLTAIALLIIAKKDGHEVIINTAAASALGQMVNRLGLSEGVQVINIVRRDTQVDLLEQQGAKNVLNSSEPNFDQQLHDVCHQYSVRLALDAVAGPMTMKLLECMPKHGKVTVYGGLSHKLAQVNPAHLIFQNKAIDGFRLTTWLGEKNILKNLMLWRRAQKRLSTDLRSEVRAQYPLQDAQIAAREYQAK